MYKIKCLGIVCTNTKMGLKLMEAHPSVSFGYFP